MAGIEIRIGLQDTQNEGAYEEGRYLTVLGRKLLIGDTIPEGILFRSNNMLSVTRELSLIHIPGSYLIYSVNGLGTPVCAAEAENCHNKVFHLLPNGARMYGLSNEDPDLLDKFTREMGIGHRFYSTKGTDTGIKMGLYLANEDYEGMLQRGLFAVVNQRLVYAEYVYDQGGPLPDFEAAIRALKPTG